MSEAIGAKTSLYRQVLDEVKTLLRTVEGESSDSKLDQALSVARELFTAIQDDLTTNLSALEKAADWKTFTVAFYGETNAGKSTIIEVLRILLHEESKIEERNQFRELQNRLSIDEKSLHSVRTAILDTEESIASLKDLATVADATWIEDHMRLSQVVNEASENLRNKWDDLNIFMKIFRFIFKLPEHFSLKEALQKLHIAEQDFQCSRDQLAHDLSNRIKTLAQLNHNHEVMEKGLHELEPFADGIIIGNGKSDFTLESQRYLIDVGGQEIALLDVPGIEGKEARVSDSIWSSVRTAHAVFYVTSKAAAPQTGDGVIKGTLEKIKEHLGSQTEVWSIFNKRITNPIQLDNGELVNSGELGSLAVLDEKMRELIGESYQGTLMISGMVAFLASAECLVPGHETHKRRVKFLEKFDQKALIDLSGVNSLIQMLSGSFVVDYKAKIRRANIKKAAKVVEAALLTIKKLEEDQFGPLEKLLQREFKSASAQLVSAQEGLKSRLYSTARASVEDFKKSTRKTVYKVIDKDVSNEGFKRLLEETVKENQDILEKSLPDRMKGEVTIFEQEVLYICERFQKHTEELLSMYANFSINGLGDRIEIKIDMKSGVNVAGLITSIIGAIVLALSTGGTAGVVAIVFGVIGVVISFTKSILGAFSSDYKKAQQRKATDENLQNICSALINAMESNINDLMKKVEVNVAGMEKNLEASVIHTREINRLLKVSSNNMNSLYNKILTAE